MSGASEPSCFTRSQMAGAEPVSPIVEHIMSYQPDQLWVVIRDGMEFHGPVYTSEDTAAWEALHLNLKTPFPRWRVITLEKYLFENYSTGKQDAIWEDTHPDKDYDF